jgi:hypothetical protein
MSENIIKNINNKHLLDVYYRDHLKILLDNDIQKKKYFEELKGIDNLGMFFRIFLVELEFFSNRIIGQSYKPFLLGEIESFVDYLKQITPEKTPVKVKLDFEKAFLKLHIILIRSEKIIQVGIDNYLEAVDICLDKGCNSFYIIYFEKEKNSYWHRLNSLIDDLIREIKNRIVVEQVFDEHYQVFTERHEKRIGRCIRFINTEKI